MQIEFELPFFYSPVSSPVEQKEARASLNNCASAIKAIYAKHGLKSPRTVIRRSGAVRVLFDLPQMFTMSTPQARLVNSKVLKVLMECLISLNVIYLRANPNTPDLYQSGVYYERTTVWDMVPALYARGYGDCKTLSAALVAQLRLAGKPANPVFRFRFRQDGGLDYHILVQLADGTFEDPSRVLGMGSNENAQQRFRD